MSIESELIYKIVEQWGNALCSMEEKEQWLKDYAKRVRNPSEYGLQGGKWISVKDRLPDYNVKVLLLGESVASTPQMGGAYVVIGRRQDLSKTSFAKNAERYQDENQFSGMRYVTHWMPMPLKPDESAPLVHQQVSDEEINANRIQNGFNASNKRRRFQGRESLHNAKTTNQLDCMKEKVSVVGIGRLGLAFALLLDSKGYDVCGCDVNDGYIDSLRAKSFKSDEPYINEMLDACNINFTASETVAFDFSPLIFIFVPTPSKEDGAYDHKHIEQIISGLEAYAKGKPCFKTVVISCTVMPRYCAALQERLAGLKIEVVYNPEFIAQGNIIYGLRYADIVLIGGKLPALLRRIYLDIMEKAPVFKYLTLTGAEIAKISINCFLTMKIAFANMIGEIIINSGEERSVSDILSAIGSDSRIGNKCLHYGFPVGGVCLPRDQKALGVHAREVGVDTTFTGDIDVENKRHSEYLKDYWMAVNPDVNVPFSFSYLGYKKGVSILTESYQLKLCMDLLQEGYKVIVPPAVCDMGVPPLFKEYFCAKSILFEPIEGAVKIN